MESSLTGMEVKALGHLTTDPLKNRIWLKNNVVFIALLLFRSRHPHM